MLDVAVPPQAMQKAAPDFSETALELVFLVGVTGYEPATT
jgi:hypothetical protein